MNPTPTLPTLSLLDAFEFLGDESSNGVWTFARAKERATGRIVVVFRLTASVAPDARARFEREAAAAAQLSHPGLISVYVAARDARSGEAFCAVEAPEGVRLSDRFTLGPLIESDLYALARRLAESIAHAHSRNFPLGGLEPRHVIVTEDGAARIRALGATRIGAPAVPRIDDDPYFERADDGTRRDPSFSGDLRSLGKLLFHAATGEPPHSVALGLLPAWLRPIVSRCLDETGADRFLRGSEVVAALLPLANRFRPQDESARAAIESLSITLSPSRATPQKSPHGATPTPSPVPGRVTPTPPSARSPSDGGATPGSPFPWQPVDAQYEVESPPRLGGMGTVIKAKDRATDRFVAIKRIRRDMLGSDSVAQRFRREARSIARLNHPNILSLLHCARDEEGDYLVLEWAEGGSLRDRLTRLGHLPFDEVVDIARKIGAALIYAHGKGVIHRDIKPHNVLLTESGEPKLADFGLARAIGDLTAESSHAGAGTPLYIAPEQWKESRQADARSDLYSFAKMLYHLATGDAPSSIEAERIPKRLRAPLLKALRDRPEERFVDVAQFLREIERSLESSARLPIGKILVILLLTIGAGALSAWVGALVRDRVSRDDAPRDVTHVDPDPIAGPAGNSDPSEPKPTVDPKRETPPPSPSQDPPAEATKPAPDEPVKPKDVAPPSVEFTTLDGAPLRDKIVTFDSSVLLIARAEDDVGVVEASRVLTAPGDEPASEPVSTMALRGGTTMEFPLHAFGVHRLELRARDAAGNVTIRPLVAERRGRLPGTLDEAFASITPPAGSRLDTPGFDLSLEAAASTRDARWSLVSSDGADSIASGEWTFDDAGRASRAMRFASGASRMVLRFRVEREFHDPSEVELEYTFVRGRAPHPDPSRFTIVLAAEDDDSYPRRIRHAATGIEFVLVDDVSVGGGKRPPFYVGAREVSIAEYRASSRRDAASGGLTLDRDQARAPSNAATFESPLPEWPEIAIDAAMPATQISRDDALAYCAEFEFALLDAATWTALAGKFRDDGLFVNLASSEANAPIKFTVSRGPDGWPTLAPTSIFRADRRGLHCLWGNVAEWLAPASAGTSASAAGGSWIDSSEAVLEAPMIAVDASTRAAWIGFRVRFDPR